MNVHDPLRETVLRSMKVQHSYCIKLMGKNKTTLDNQNNKELHDKVIPRCHWHNSPLEILHK